MFKAEVYQPPEIDLAVISGVPRAGKTGTADVYAKLNPLALVQSMDITFRQPLWDDAEYRIRGFVDLCYGSNTPVRRLNQKHYDSENFSDDTDWIKGVLGNNSPKPYIFRQNDQSAAVYDLGDMEGALHDMACRRQGQPTPLLESMVPISRMARFRDKYPDIGLRVIYLVNNNPNHPEIIQAAVDHAHETGDLDGNWMAKAGWSRQRIAAYMEQMGLFSLWTAEQADKEGFPWIDMGRGDFEDNKTHVAQYLSGMTGLITYRHSLLSYAEAQSKILQRAALQ